MDTNTDQPQTDELLTDTDALFAARRRYGRPGPKSLVEHMQSRQRPPRRPPVVPPELADLLVFERLPDDPAWVEPHGADHPLGASRFAGIYDNAGEPIPFEPREELLRRLRGIRRRMGLTSLYHRGANLVVSTVFLGASTRISGPPDLWETMLFTGHPDDPRGAPLDGRWRYSSQRAAIVGHGLIVAAIRDAYADARPAAPGPQRPGPRPWRRYRRR